MQPRIVGLSFFNSGMISSRKLGPSHKRLHPTNDRGTQTEGEHPNSSLATKFVVMVMRCRELSLWYVTFIVFSVVVFPVSVVLEWDWMGYPLSIDHGMDGVFGE
jgi:hypothetical protein